MMALFAWLQRRRFRKKLKRRAMFTFDDLQNLNLYTLLESSSEGRILVSDEVFFGWYPACQLEPQVPSIYKCLLKLTLDDKHELCVYAFRPFNRALDDSVQKQLLLTFQAICQLANRRPQSAAFPVFATLVQQSLKKCKPAWEALFHLPLQGLTLEECVLDKSINAFHFKGVTELNLDWTCVEPQLLADIVKESTKLKTLKLRRLEHTCLKEAFKAIGDNETLLKLCLEDIKIGKAAWTSLLEAMTRNHTIRTLRLDKTHRGGANPKVERRTKAIASMLQTNVTLMDLDISPGLDQRQWPGILEKLALNRIGLYTERAQDLCRAPLPLIVPALAVVSKNPDFVRALVGVTLTSAGGTRRAQYDNVDEQ